MSVTTAFPDYVVVDVEVSMYKNDDGDWENLPHYTNSKGKSPSILLVGWLPVISGTRALSKIGTADLGIMGLPAVRGTMRVGHNFAFDHQHLWHTGLPSVDSGGLWDTMIAAYVLSAQARKFTSLGELMQSELGRPPKRDLIGEMLARGIPPQDIPLAELTEYLKGDLTNTADVFEAQWAKASSKERSLIRTLSEASLVYARCQHNGLLLDTEETVSRRDACFKTVERMTNGFKEVWVAGNPSIKDDIADVDRKLCKKGGRSGGWAVSPTAMSSLFFKTPMAIDIGTVPNPGAGPRRVRDVVLLSPLTNISSPIPDPPAHSGRSALSTADDVLKKLVAAAHEPHTSLARMEQHRRAAHKLGTTYYQALLEQGARYNRRIHPRIHTTSTHTGRTSSSDPNIQNQPVVTREVFVADPDKTFMEFDFQQLEIWALAVVSQCPNLIAALKAGQDIHWLTGLRAGMWDKVEEMTKEKRTLVKRINFGLIYGGGAKTLSEQSGAPINVVRRIISGFYDTFRGVRDYHKKLVEWVQSGIGGPPNEFFVSREVVTRLGTHGTLSDIVVATQTGRKYLFTEDTPGAGVSVTRIKNYFIQGFGTGDFVQLMLAGLSGILHPELWRAVVHDSALLCLNPHAIKTVEHVLIDVKANAISHAVHNWGIKNAADVPLNLSIEIKPRWSPMKDDMGTPEDLAAAA